MFSSLKIVDNHVFEYSGLIRILWPKKIKKMQNECIHRCCLLESVGFTSPSSLAEIGDLAFAESGLTLY